MLVHYTDTNISILIYAYHHIWGVKTSHDLMFFRLVAVRYFSFFCHDEEDIGWTFRLLRMNGMMVLS